MPLSDAELLATVGEELPGDTFRVEPYEDWIFRDVVLAPPGDGMHLHPLWAFIASVRAMGISVEGLFQRFGTSSSDGPMLAGSRIAWHRPPAAGQTYTTRAWIERAERKHGRRAGTFDLVTVAVQVSDENGERVLSVRDSYVFPHRSST